MKSIIIVFLFCQILVAGCSDARPQASKPVLPSPSPFAQATPSPVPLTPKEHWERAKELVGQKISSPEEWRELLEHLTAVANSKMPERHKARSLIKRIRGVVAKLPTGEELKQAKQICEDLSGGDVAILTDELKKSLHDPSSLQDFQIEKCVPVALDGSSVTLLASYRAKNTYGALTLNEEQFLVVKSEDGKAKYRAVIWVNEK